MNQILESQQTSHISPSRASIVRILEKIDRIMIMAPHCTFRIVATSIRDQSVADSLALGFHYHHLMRILWSRWVRKGCDRYILFVKPSVRGSRWLFSIPGTWFGAKLLFYEHKNFHSRKELYKISLHTKTGQDQYIPFALKFTTQPNPVKPCKLVLVLSLKSSLIVPKGWEHCRCQLEKHRPK